MSATVQYKEIMFGGSGGIMATDKDFTYDPTTQTLSVVWLTATTLTFTSVSATDLTTTWNTIIGNAVSDTLTINSATTLTTGFSIVWATTTAISLAWDATTWISITSAMSATNMVSLAWTWSNAGILISWACWKAIEITGNATTAIWVLTGTFWTGLSLAWTLTTGIEIGACTSAILTADDSVVRIWTTRTNAATYIGMEFDKTTTGVWLFTMGSTANPMVLNTNPWATVIAHTINVLHSAGAWDCDDLIGSYVKSAVTWDWDSGLTAVGHASRAYVGTASWDATVVSQLYGSQPWVSHFGTGAVTAMSALSAKCDVNTGNFTATTVNAWHFHIEWAATVTAQFDWVMIEAYPDVTCLDSMLAIAVDTGAVTTNAIRLSWDYTSFLNFAAANTAVVISGTEASGNGAKIAINIGGTPYFINAHPTSNN
jgi:hypothetical protein